jgi:AbrB family looped-hinge helix DNA binding protein
MVDISITSMSSKGQVVIPQEMRSNIKEGEKLVIIEDNGMYIIKKASDYSKTLKEDIEFAKRTQKVYLEVQKGKYSESSAEDFLKKVQKDAR